jgi:hypothetical protein
MYSHLQGSAHQQTCARMAASATASLPILNKRLHGIEGNVRAQIGLEVLSAGRWGARDEVRALVNSERGRRSIRIPGRRLRSRPAPSHCCSVLWRGAARRFATLA